MSSTGSFPPSLPLTPSQEELLVLTHLHHDDDLLVKDSLSYAAHILREPGEDSEVFIARVGGDESEELVGESSSQGS